MRRRTVTTWKVVRRCVVFLTTLCIIPVLLVLLVTTDQYMRPMRTHRTIYQQEIEITNETVLIKQPMTLVNMAEVELRMDERRRHLQDTCHRLGLDIPGNDSFHRPNPWEFLVNRPFKIVWCNVFKAASTSWMYNFNLLAGYSPFYLKKSKLVPLHLARKKYPRPSLIELREAVNDSVTFLIVRHPLERLLSAYRDKLQFSLPFTLHQKLGNQIILKYRPGAKKGLKLNKPRWPTFQEFVRYLVDTYKQGHDLDMHWTPITQFCTPCMVPFDIIAKMETLQEDQVYLIKQAHLENIIKPEWKNHGKGRQTKQLIDGYYSQLTRGQIKDLYHIYRYDFELFNYTIDEYMHLAQPESDDTSLLA